jgi:hypothetical protein
LQTFQIGQGEYTRQRVQQAGNGVGKDFARIRILALLCFFPHARGRASDESRGWGIRREGEGVVSGVPGYEFEHLGK